MYCLDLIEWNRLRRSSCRCIRLTGISCLIAVVFLVFGASAQENDGDIGFNVLELLKESIVDPNPSIREVCYKDVGCFSKDTGLTKHIGLLPMPPNQLNTKFFLFKRKVPARHIELNPEIPESLSIINSSFPVLILVHGFAMNTSTDFFVETRNAILEKLNATLIMVDYTEGVKPSDYPAAVVTSELVARQIGILVYAMNKHLQIPPKKFHLVGFSLGAHTCAMASNWLQDRGIKIGRISGLDPASPLYEGHGKELTLDPTDADYVDVIHTSSGNSILEGEVGMQKPLGHADFYPNGGSDQKGCKKLNVGCSHQRAVDYFTASIKPGCSFRSYPCENFEKFESGHCVECHDTGCGRMGYYSDQAIGRGVFYLETGGQAPFCFENQMQEVRGSTSGNNINSSTTKQFAFSLYILSIYLAFRTLNLQFCLPLTAT